MFVQVPLFFLKKKKNYVAETFLNAIFRINLSVNFFINERFFFSFFTNLLNEMLFVCISI